MSDPKVDAGVPQERAETTDDGIVIGLNTCIHHFRDGPGYCDACLAVQNAQAEGKCVNCKERPATLDWVGDGGVLAYTHGMSVRWCEVCALRAQLDHAKAAAQRIPELEAKSAPAAHQERTLEPSKGCIDSTPFLRARMHWYRDGCPELEDVAQYFASGECARDAANDLELALTDIETLRAQRAVAEEKGARLHAAVTATEEGHSVLAHKYNDRAACPACNEALKVGPR